MKKYRAPIKLYYLLLINHSYFPIPIVSAIKIMNVSEKSCKHIRARTNRMKPSEKGYGDIKFLHEQIILRILYI